MLQPSSACMHVSSWRLVCGKSAQHAYRRYVTSRRCPLVCKIGAGRIVNPCSVSMLSDVKDLFPAASDCGDLTVTDRTRIPPTVGSTRLRSVLTTVQSSSSIYLIVRHCSPDSHVIYDVTLAPAGPREQNTYRSNEPVIYNDVPRDGQKDFSCTSARLIHWTRNV